jgi:hypothetical protein
VTNTATHSQTRTLVSCDSPPLIRSSDDSGHQSHGAAVPPLPLPLPPPDHQSRPPEPSEQVGSMHQAAGRQAGR